MTGAMKPSLRVTGGGERAVLREGKNGFARRSHGKNGRRKEKDGKMGWAGKGGDGTAGRLKKG